MLRDLPRSDPASDLGEPDHRSATRYLLWVAGSMKRSLVLGVSLAIVWMVAQALMPAVIGRAIDRGVIHTDTGALVLWSAALFGLGVVQAVAGVFRHRLAVYNWVAGAVLTVQVVIRQAVRLGGTLPRRLATGEIVAVGVADISHVGHVMDITARAGGSVVAIVTVGGFLLATSGPVGLAVLVGVPLMAAAMSTLLRPMHHRQQRQRELVGELATRSSDIVAGLRVLRGIGGEQLFTDRYRAESQQVRQAGVRVASIESMLSGAEILLPGLLITLVTWFAARFAISGRLTVGELVACYGYAVFLVRPLATLTEAADKYTRGHVSARRVVRILQMRRELSDPADTGDHPGIHSGTHSGSPNRAAVPGGDLVDLDSGLVVRPGRLLGVAASVPAEAQAIADRLGRHADGDVSWGGVPLRGVPLRVLRRRVLVTTNDDALFSGTLAGELDPAGAASPEDLRAALHAACAADVVEALPEGLDASIAEGGREFSGGQRQRLRLARALIADPDVLILVEPTSAVDAHTEARIAARLAKARSGRTTVVCSTSPLVLDRVDSVAYVEGGRVVAEGTHRQLLDTEPDYAATVTRGEMP